MIVADVVRGSRRVRVRLRSHHGRPVVDVRFFFEKSGAPIPTPIGLVVEADELHELAAALEVAAVRIVDVEPSELESLEAAITNRQREKRDALDTEILRALLAARPTVPELARVLRRRVGRVRYAVARLIASGKLRRDREHRLHIIGGSEAAA